MGSQARQVKPADEYSDLDVVLYTVEGFEQKCEIYLQWLRDFAPVWMIVEDHGEATKGWLILYQGGVKVDFSVKSIGRLQRVIHEKRLRSEQERGYTILLDKDGIAAQLPAPTLFDPPPYTPPTQAQFITCVEGFYYGTVYLAKQLVRGNLWKVKWADQIQQRMLLEMLEWHAHATHNKPVDTYSRGDFMRDWVSETTWQELHSVFAHFDAEDSWHALLASIHLFRRLMEETSAKLDYDYPRKMVEEVTDYVLLEVR